MHDATGAPGGRPVPATAGVDPWRSVPLPMFVWDGMLYCHAPLDAAIDPDTIPTMGEPVDRWSRADEPTVYLASDPGVALGELARHHPRDEHRMRHRIVALRPRPGALRGLVDLRDHAIDQVLGLPPAATWCVDRKLARDVAALLREDPRHRGLIVPSMAFMDQPSRCNVVLFADRLEQPFSELLAGWDQIARVVG
jgi:RES domain-containing protein